ncbi:MAG TPA: sigma-70 family RNA polymerase sigma factor [Acidimicrobiia bacterium]|nr:sigma-70 family RNA polymerase sigma factor [Acidimicrobiia bacterium]
MQPDDPGTAAPASFDEMFRDTYWPMVRSLAIACGDREVAEDAVQDAFERAFVRWRRISRYDDPPSWVRHVALNRLRDHFRKETNKRKAVDRLSGDAVATEPAYEPAGDVATLLAHLPPQQRIAAALFYVEDLSVREVAESMKLSEGAVKYHLHAARAALADRVHSP